ncbi:MAG: class I SAM-dependent methyltransferase [Candidatus Thiodiazotropha sp.]
MTNRVRAFYEAHPYPPGDAPDCDAYQARLLLSYIERQHPVSASLKILEAGCGRGINLTRMAGVCSGDRFTGIDINRVAIREAAARVEHLGYSNLEFVEGDLLHSEGIPSVAGGYDVILSYGVLHHLSDPRQGLIRLTQHLAPEGVIGFMVDGRFGRQPLDRYREALDMIDPQADSGIARSLARVAEQGIFRATPWQGTSEVDPVEFADRCLHVHETSFDIQGLWALLASADLRFIRWIEPRDWSVDGLSDDPDLDARLNALGEQPRYQVIERLAQHPKLTLVAARRDRISRREMPRDSLDTAYLAPNPQLSRSPNRGWRIRKGAWEPALGQTEVRLLEYLAAAPCPVSAIALIGLLIGWGLSRDQATDLLLTMQKQELLYRPQINPDDLP